MVYEKMIVYIIGPGGAGKTTTGRLVAELLGWTAIDLDQAFCQYIMNIRQFIKQFGYEKYVIRNSLLLNELLVERTGLKSVFILSSGFLSTDICQETILKNRKTVNRTGVTILLMPSTDYETSLECIIFRQLTRGLKLNKETEIRKFEQRFVDYISMGEIKIFSMDKPSLIAKKIVKELQLLLHI